MRRKFEFNLSNTNIVKMILLVMLIMIVGFATANVTLDMDGKVTIATNVADMDHYIGAVIVNDVNKYNSISDDKESFTVTLPTGESIVKYYIANNSRNYSLGINMRCVKSEIISISNDYEQSILPQTVMMGTLTVTNNTENETDVICYLEGTIEESEVSALDIKTVFFAADGTIVDPPYKTFLGTTYENLPTPTMDGLTFYGWKNINDNTIASDSNIVNSSDEILFMDGEISPKLYDKIMSLSLGDSSSINFNNSSEYSELNEGFNPGVYQLANNENVYFYRGTVNNNLLYRDKCWKIIRTTDSLGTKIIYNGAAEDGKCTGKTGLLTMINLLNDYKYNELTDDIKYAGYTYLNEEVETPSLIKDTIDSWYQTNLASYEADLEDSGFCNDRSVLTDLSNVASPIEGATYFGPSARAGYNTINVNPSITCSNEDNYTKSSANGNGLLSNPIGLITSDEMVLAGATSYYKDATTPKDSNKYHNASYYLYSNTEYITMSPLWFDTSVKMAKVFSANYINSSEVNATYGIRPVIILNQNIRVISTGNGSEVNPYVVSNGVE